MRKRKLCKGLFSCQSPLDFLSRDILCFTPLADAVAAVVILCLTRAFFRKLGKEAKE